MEQYDSDKAARVWKRVHGDGNMEEAAAEAPQSARGLLALITEEWEDAARYLHLSRYFQGRDAALLRKLSEQKQGHSARLKGIYVILTGQRPVIRSAPPAKEPVQGVLQRCYGRELRRMAAYEARAADPECGQIFARLAAQEKEHCGWVLELLGRLDMHGR